MQPHWHQSIIFRTGLVLTLVSLATGALSVGITLGYNQMRAQEDSTRRLWQLLDTVEDTASVACFTGDEVLASELASGLLKSSEVLGVVIQSGDRELAGQHRDAEAGETGADSEPLARDVFSPFDSKERVGRILLTPNLAVIRDAMRRETWMAMLQTGLQLLLIVLAMTAAMLLQIVRPIKSISDSLHQMDPAQGERLPLPAGRQESEIGVLVADVNLMADRLVKTLDEERALRIQREIDERRYHAIVQNAETGIFIIDNLGTITSWNPAFARLMRVPPQAEQTSTPLSLLNLGWKEPARLGELLLRCMNDHASTSADLELGPPEGPSRWLCMVLTPIADQSIQGVVHDVTQHKEAERSARRLAVTDSLTGLANQLGLEQRLHEMVQACELKQSKGFALALVSLGDFKRFLEGFGPTAGEEILQEATARLSTCVKGSDIIARPGADQFALVLGELDRDLDAEHVAERVLRELQRHYFVSGSPVRLRINIGIAFYPHDVESDLQGLMRHANLALSHAQGSAGNGIRFFDPTFAKLAEERRSLELDLRRAVREEQFALFLQPIVDLERNCLAGAEALIRWQHPDRGLVPPDAFIPLAEETGLISDIGLWVLETACRTLADWKRQGLPYRLSVNVSGSQIPEGLPPPVLLDQVSRLGISPSQLALEITEGVLLSDVGSAQTWLQTLREAGFPIYLDDFGTGYSSLSYLKRFSVDTLKVDKSFIRDIATDPGDQALVTAVVAMARSFGMDVVAEGVEQAEHIGLLRGIGCRYAQGYYFSRPVPIESFLDVSEQIPELLRATRDT
ncbi:EAL domain-containing protein [Thiorhodococcus mannitoliphagus]|uniref:EAL domain-containing protein n=1 Tax=Thiorhodococcus mannitoliphagus TaxID=329406 RepID=A0A6P1E0S5_9GAMM|nr:EAL domain-containing protein [Thiorhodococcus mannitoliphagus]NEX21594.1 EAL domain-containing protein [Thiorhodococcus mannitoliphagus]